MEIVLQAVINDVIYVTFARQEHVAKAECDVFHPFPFFGSFYFYDTFITLLLIAEMKGKANRSVTVKLSRNAAVML